LRHLPGLALRLENLTEDNFDEVRVDVYINDDGPRARHMADAASRQLGRLPRQAIRALLEFRWRVAGRTAAKRRIWIFE
jgi:hypothetical protein